MILETPQAIQASLHQALQPLSLGGEVVLLDYPAYPNLGDHLIWLGSLVYLTQVRKQQIRYTASLESFSAPELEQKAPHAPIFLNGGGNLGDLWPKYQRFRERIVQQYPNRPIVILPQSLYFRDGAKLQQAADIFNAHPNLRIFLRDRASYQIAQQHFSHCQLGLAPDMAFQLLQWPGVARTQPPHKPLLYHCRQDQEFNPLVALPQDRFSGLKIQDWQSFEWVLGHGSSPLKRALAPIFREGWQRGLKHPQEWRDRRQWLRQYSFESVLQNVDQPALHAQSWSFLHSGIYQFQQYQKIITNRLHGHILCILLQIPHVFLANAYYKNEYFYQTWTQNLSFSKFTNQVDNLLNLLELLPSIHELK